MKHLNKIKLITFLCILISVMPSCRKMAENGDLDGQWQILSIEYSDGTITSPKGYYYCLFRSVVNLTSRANALQAGNLVYKDRELTLTMPYSTVEQLAPWGMNATQTTFDVKQLSKDKMTLQSDYALIEFRKF